MKDFFLIDEEATLNFGAKLATVCPANCIIYLHGNLGAGKTTLVRGFLLGLGFTGTVKSPTYTLVEPYEINGKTIFHFDLYRLNNPEELEDIGIRDYLSASAIALIEWPEKGISVLPTADMEITLQVMNNGRQIIINSQTKKGLAILEKI